MHALTSLDNHIFEAAVAQYYNGLSERSKKWVNLKRK